MSFSFFTPTEVFLGNGSIQRVKDIVFEESFKKAIIITDRGVSEAGLLSSLKKTLTNYCDIVIFDGVEPDPTDVVIKKAFKFYEEHSPDFIVAVGGGSAIDTAKALAILATNGGEIVDYKGVDKVKNLIKPLIAVPTTAGTGSEVTATTVITDTKNTMKYSIVDKKIVPDWAIVDPELTLTLPARHTAATGVDALVHAIESYTSRNSQTLTDALAKEAIRLISENLRKAVYQGDNIDARQKMMEASLMAGIAFNNAKLGLCHVLCNPLGAHYNIPHGVANAILLPSVTSFNLPARIEKYAEIAELLGETVEGCSKEKAAQKSVIAMRNLIRDVNLPSSLKAYGVDREDFAKLVDECFHNPLVQINPRVASKSELISILEKSY